jgi:streptomycin 6-kinase
VLQRAWAVPPVPTLQTGAEKATWLSGFIEDAWRELGEPCSARVVERALEYAEERRRAFDPDGAVLVHGDAHAVNTLQIAVESGAGPTPFKLVDPDGLFAEPACDLAVPMREYSHELLAAGDTVRATHERCAFLSRLTGVDPAPIWQWGFVERVSTGLFALRLGWETVGADMLAVADRVASGP